MLTLARFRLMKVATLQLRVRCQKLLPQRLLFMDFECVLWLRNMKSVGAKDIEIH